MVAEQCTSQLDPGKEKASTQGPGCAVWVEQLLQGELFPPKATEVINIEKMGLLSEQHKDEKLFVSASCLLI